MAFSDICRSFERFGRAIAALLLLSLASTGAAAADGLFGPLPDSQLAAAADRPTPDTGVLRSRDVALDPSYLSSRIAPLGVDNAADRLQQAPVATGITIELFPGLVAELQRKTFDKAFGGGFVWTGQVAGNPLQGANLVIRDGKVTGVVDFGAHAYRIDPLGVGNAHRISEIDDGAFPGDIVVPADTTNSLPMPGPGRGAAGPPTEITILIAYTARAQTEFADMVAQANLAVSRANSAFTASGIDITFTLVGTPLVNGFDETATPNFGTILDTLRNGTTSGPFQPVHALRDSAGADLVSLFIKRNSTDSCGIGYYVQNPTTANAAFGMNVVGTSCVTNESFVHEAGHNMGLLHDRYAENAIGGSASLYNYGYVNLGAQIRDIMSYNDQCAAQNPSFFCQRVNMFSTPLLTSNGNTIGVAAGQAGAADNARRLNETKAAIASYRATVAPPAPIIVAAVTPVSRATSVGGQVTAFATVINAGTTTATGCSIALPGGAVGVNFTYKTRDFNTDALGPDNTPVDIAGGNTRQDFLMVFNPTQGGSGNIQLIFDCTNTAPAASVVGLNTFLLTAQNPAPSDLISIAVTATNDGIANVPLGSTGFAALAGNNIGAAATLTATVSAAPIGGSATLPATLRICQTDTSGACSSPANSASITFNAPANQIVTFTAFIDSNGTAIPFDPANTRMFVNFTQAGTAVGSASVAVRTVAADQSLASAK